MTEVVICNLFVKKDNRPLSPDRIGALTGLLTEEVRALLDQHPLLFIRADKMTWCLRNPDHVQYVETVHKEYYFDEYENRTKPLPPVEKQ
jgi:hypothetical protein